MKLTIPTFFVTFLQCFGHYELRDHRVIGIRSIEHFILRLTIKAFKDLEAPLQLRALNFNEDPDLCVWDTLDLVEETHRIATNALQPFQVSYHVVIQRLDPNGVAVNFPFTARIPAPGDCPDDNELEGTLTLLGIPAADIPTVMAATRLLEFNTVERLLQNDATAHYQTLGISVRTVQDINAWLTNIAHISNKFNADYGNVLNLMFETTVFEPSRVGSSAQTILLGDVEDYRTMSTKGYSYENSVEEAALGFVISAAREFSYEPCFQVDSDVPCLHLMQDFASKSKKPGHV